MDVLTTPSRGWISAEGSSTLACRVRVNTLRPGRAPRTRPTKRMVVLMRSSIPRRMAKVDTNNSPALATRRTSPKVTVPVANVGGRRLGVEGEDERTFLRAGVGRRRSGFGREFTGRNLAWGSSATSLADPMTGRWIYRTDDPEQSVSWAWLVGSYLCFPRCRGFSGRWSRDGRRRARDRCGPDPRSCRSGLLRRVRPETSG